MAGSQPPATRWTKSPSERFRGLRPLFSWQRAQASVASKRVRVLQAPQPSESRRASRTAANGFGIARLADDGNGTPPGEYYERDEHVDRAGTECTVIGLRSGGRAPRRRG